MSGGTTILEQRLAARLTEGAARANSDGDEGGAESGDEGSSGVEVDASLGTFFEVPDDGRAGSPNILRIKVRLCGLLDIYARDAFPPRMFDDDVGVLRLLLPLSAFCNLDLVHFASVLSGC